VVPTKSIPANSYLDSGDLSRAGDKKLHKKLLTKNLWVVKGFLIPAIQLLRHKDATLLLRQNAGKLPKKYSGKKLPVGV
jgi:hypothetical protein